MWTSPRNTGPAGDDFRMNRILAVMITAVVVMECLGCATLRNTKIPEAFREVGLCAGCKRLMALDGLSDGMTCECPNCGRPFVVADVKTAFKRRCADLKNRKTAMSCLAVGMTAASIAGAIYGIPIPPAPVDEETFRPYELPMLIECRQASPAGPQPAEPAEPAPLAVETAEAR